MPRHPARQEPPVSGPIAEWAPYPRPDRAEIAARVEAELAAQPYVYEGAGAVIGRRQLDAFMGPGPDPLDDQPAAGNMPADIPAAAPPPRGEMRGVRVRHDRSGPCDPVRR